MRTLILTAALTALAAPALAESHVSGDAEAGEAAFGKQCVTCHVVVDEDGEKLAGRNAKTGPNLYGIAGALVGDVDDFRYSSAMKKAGEAELEWTEENFVAYVQDPTGWLREALDDSKARGKMSFKVRKEEDAADIYAYLASIGPEMDMEDDDMDGDGSMEESN